MAETDPRADERAFYDNTDYSELDLERADDVQVVVREPSEVTETMRLEAINNLMRWQTQDMTAKAIIKAVLAGHNQPSIGHLARFCPDAFDEMYEETSALVRNDL